MRPRLVFPVPRASPRHFAAPRECDADCDSDAQCGGAEDGCGGTCDEACPVCCAKDFLRERGPMPPTTKKSVPPLLYNYSTVLQPLLALRECQPDCYACLDAPAVLVQGNRVRNKADGRSGSVTDTYFGGEPPFHMRVKWDGTDYPVGNGDYHEATDVTSDDCQCGGADDGCGGTCEEACSVWPTSSYGSALATTTFLPSAPGLPPPLLRRVSAMRTVTATVSAAAPKTAAAEPATKRARCAARRIFLRERGPTSS